MNKLVIVTIVYLAVSVFTTHSDDNFFRRNYGHDSGSSRFDYREVFSLNRLEARSRRSLYDETYETDNGLRDYGFSPLGGAPKPKAIDNRKPVIVNCEGYALSLKEESVPGTYVTQINAIDPDEHQTITYSFVASPTERTMFRIDKNTGRITTIHRFDRDEPIRDKMVYITVRATDNGLPALDDVCTFKVTIEDINDNPPIFDKTRYDLPITKDAKVGSKVGSISAYDFDDGDNSIIKFEILKRYKDHSYFRINENNGIITLTKSIDKSPGQKYEFNVRAYNPFPGVPQMQDAEVDVSIYVIESNKLPPYFTGTQQQPISLEENFSNYSEPLATLRANSQANNPELIFELITGRTEQTNSRNTFVLDQKDDTAVILLGKALDYETITEYTLTVSVRNTHDLIAQTIVKVKVLDVNDNIPYFTEVTSGWIPENEPAGTPVMQVRAFDMDGTAANNIVSFRLADNNEHFAIDPNTGNITALTMFDREATDMYHLKIIAEDNSPSALYNNGLPNSIAQKFNIKISDKNDHPPKFTKELYVTKNVAEDENINTVIAVVTAQDVDTASQISYSIVSGNIGDAFKIDEATGAISVNNQLDYETITQYTLQVRAFDGTYDDNATVSIKVEDVNDNLPVFAKTDYILEIEEEKVMQGCIETIEAWDPDIKNRSAPQHIKFAIVKVEQRPLLDIDDNGCLRQKAPLDRDPPNGHKAWQVIISATDEDGSGRQSTTTVNIMLNDTNDNPPYLTNIMPVVWYENQEPGRIVTLTADDYDEPQNGPPFRFEIPDSASGDIKSKFRIDTDVLYALVRFDREEQKEYSIPILVTDSGQPQPLSKINMLYLVIGDVNDNEMRDGESKIFVYNYKGESPDAEIGRVYVDDLDDWDLPDKKFMWKEDTYSPSNFELNPNTGMITMLQDTRGGDYELHFTVTEKSSFFPKHSVSAKVLVTVKEIPEEAVDKSGSIRFYGITAEEFVSRTPSLLSTPKDRLQNSIAEMFNISRDNVDVFTVLQHDNNATLLDVRFSAHGSPYYEPEKLNGMIGYHQRMLEEELGLKMMMISIDECIQEKLRCELSCKNVLHKSSVPIAVYTNTSSFVGVNAFVQAECVCEAPPVINECLNGGTPFNDKCECHEGYEGPNCEEITIGFYGHGYAMYPPISPCNITRIKLELSPQREDGLVMYIGPLSYNPLLPIQDFLALELVKGLPVLLLDYGSGTIRIEHKHRYFQGKPFTVEIVLQPQTVEMIVDNCKLSTCMSLDAPKGPNESLNVNAPLQLGGSAVNLESLGSMFNWTYVPQSKGFTGCLKNLTINDRTYNLGAPSLAKNHDPGCHRSVAVAVSFGIDSNFLIAIIVCIAVLLILLLAVVVHKKHQDGWHEKDMDDIRETIINYEEEGGGERDAEYDLTVLRAPPIYMDKPYGNDLRQKEANEVPDIGAFLTDKKDACDRDVDAYPIDDVRHYAYEGDGNSSGSLSSLASCTDEGDLKFNYLSNFGPRFRKLADMYGEEPSDTDSNVDDDEGWRI